MAVDGDKLVRFSLLQHALGWPDIVFFIESFRQIENKDISPFEQNRENFNFVTIFVLSWLRMEINWWGFLCFSMPLGDQRLCFLLNPFVILKKKIFPPSNKVAKISFLIRYLCLHGCGWRLIGEVSFASTCPWGTRDCVFYCMSLISHKKSGAADRLVTAHYKASSSPWPLALLGWGHYVIRSHLDAFAVRQGAVADSLL